MCQNDFLFLNYFRSDIISYYRSNSLIRNFIWASSGRARRMCDESFIYDLLMGESSDGDDDVENDSEDGEEDNVELEDHVSDIEDIVQNQNLSDVPLDASDYKDDDDILQAFLYLTREKDKRVM